MSLTVGSHTPPQLPAPVEQSTTAQVQARVVVPVPSTAVTATGKQSQSGQANADTSRRGRDGGPRGRLLDITV
ncbi:MAG TPA: hypothetical protein VM689_26350 [Aliidongia sp.]|nr:hypothetical protein [Aliidongia sp.]